MNLALLLPVGVGIALLWKGQQLCRDPRDPALFVVVLNILFAEIGDLLIEFAPHEGLPPGVPMLVQNVLLIAGTYLLVAFFLFAGTAGALPRVLTQLIPAGAAALTMVLAWTVMSPAARSSPPPLGEPAPFPVATYFLVGLAYFGYTNVICIVLALRTARQADRHPAIGLRLAALGLAGAFVCLPVHRTVRILLGYGHITLPAAQFVENDVAVLWLLLFLVGLCWPGLVTRGRTVRRIATLWGRGRELRPLRRLLGPALERLSDGRPDTGSPWTRRRRLARWRWTERWVECRDGLVVASAYLPDDLPPPASGAEAAQALHTALDRIESGEPAGRPRRFFAVPAADTFDADLASLVDLARAVDRRETRGALVR